MTEIGFKQPPPIDGLVYDFVFDEATCTWIPWMNVAPAFKYDARMSFADMIIPTMDSVRYCFLLSALNDCGKHILFTGDTGTGKTVNVSTYLAKMHQDMSPLTLQFSAATSANQTEDLLFFKMTKRRARVYGPPFGKRFIVFVDDMNMPAREEYFAQPPIELLRQFMDHGGWYNRRALSFIELHDINFIGAMGPPGGGRNPVTPRFLRHFCQIAHTELERPSLRLIFGTIVKCCLNKFDEVIQQLTNHIVDSSCDVYGTICSQLLPTPAKSHYTFNLRDVAKVFQGVLGGNPNKIKEPAQLARLWVHENWRVFGDRLINDQDRDWLDSVLGENMQKHYGLSWDETIPKECLMFGDYMAGMDAEQKNYDEITDEAKVTKVIVECLNEYNEQNTRMPLVMFLDAIQHVSRIIRVLRNPGGNALLLGVGGSGRQSLTRLATFISEYTLFRVEVSKTFGETEWHDALRQMLLDAGLKEQPTVFLFSDTQITHESFLEDVNGILNSGDVPNLYAQEDEDNIFVTCQVDCQKKGIAATKLNVFNQYIARVKANLHIVLTMSPLGDSFARRLRMFPALVTCCTIDWFSDWPVAALVGVADASLNDDEDLKLGDSGGIVEMFGYIHSSVTTESLRYRDELRRYNYVTPTSYLELLNVFKKLLREKRNEVGGLRHKLQFGLDRLADASKHVAELQDDLEKKQPVLKATQEEVAEMMVSIAKDTEDAEVTKAAVAVKEDAASTKAAECKAIKDDAQGELDKALPMLDKAVESLKELNKQHIDEIRNFKSPPANVVLTMEATCIMLKHVLKFKVAQKTEGMSKVPDYWATASQNFLKKPQALLETLQTYDKDNIPEKVIKDVSKYISNENFDPAVVAKSSIACKAICMWVHAMNSYHGVAKTVAPKRAMLKEAEAELSVVEAELNVTRSELKGVMDKLDALNSNYQAAVDKSQALQDEVVMCKLKLERANTLIGGLGGEATRWTAQVGELSGQYDCIVGDVLVSCGAIAYLGAFTSEYRQKLVNGWRDKLVELNIQHTPGCDVRQTLADPVKIQAWNISGLPTDSVSTENGIIMSKANRWPLLIDPQGQAGKFIRNLGLKEFPDTGMILTKQTDKGFLQNVESGVQFGKWVLIESVLQDIDPSLEPLLLQETSTGSVKLGDKMVTYSPEFRLYMCTNLPNPHYQPELQVKVTLLNFTITPVGLQDQMLGVVVAKEMPEMEAKKKSLIVQNANAKRQLQEIGDQILKLLSEAKGDILDDGSLIDILAESKKTSTEINKQVKEAEEVSIDIDKTRLGYVPVAERASLLYFTISDLNLIDPMYQYSLEWFVRLFISGIANSEASTDIEQRLMNLNTFFTRSLYENVCRSLFEAHKMLFSVLLAVQIMMGAGTVNAGEWRHLVAGAAPRQVLENPAPDWLAEDQWTQVLALADLESFPDFEKSFVENLPSWKRFCDSVEPHREKFPEPWESKLTVFQKLLPLRALRSDKMTPALQHFISDSMGASYNSPPQFDITLSFKDSTNISPLIFVLSTGADPTDKLMLFAKESGVGSDRFNKISLGQGQGGRATKMIEEGVKRGGWVLLQNCHLAVSWLPTLEVICEGLKPDETHEEFRLWLTSAPTPKFPVSMLQNGVKMTNEPAKGLRANLLQSYYNFTDQFMNKSSKPDAFKKLLFSLCFFHAVILDRRKFGPLGWNVPYAFGENDLGVCITQLREFIDMYEDIPYTVIHFLAYDINYGGRVTDNQDRRTIMTILDDFMNPRVQDNEYKFSASGKYWSIPAGSKEDYVKYIESMPHVPEPEVFGLHDNAEITSAKEETNLLFSTILALLPRTSSAGGGKSREDIIGETAKAVLGRLPQEWELESVSKRYPTLYSESMNTVLVQEVARYNKLLLVVKKSLRDLQKALVGLLVMTEELEKVSDALFNNLVPALWAEVAYPSLMPLANWIQDLLARCAFIQKWIDDGTPICFWISGFFFPQAFLTGSLQNYARKTKKPIDGISFGFKVVKDKYEDIKERPEDGIYVYGLYLQGCRWDEDRHSLVDSKPKELFTTFPVMWLIPEEERKKPDTGVYFCPVYKILTRRGTLSTTGHSTNYIMPMEIPTDSPQRKWIKAGVALFAALTY
jgi:dynein heavy chain